MPLGFERLNERQKRPNPQINFIKPLDGPDKALAQDFLERVAAISYPIMKANHIAVMSLEEYAPNPEFVGRNFNAGEVIQLVLKAPGSRRGGGGGGGAWLPFRHVQMVMMHELAHCKQMNHSGYFWKVRNGYAKELRELWEKRYTGEGFWARGQTLLSGQYTNDAVPDAAFQPKHLCGGTFRSTGRKRKRKGTGKGGGEDKGTGKPKISYAERKQRRILKKFGTGGNVLGDDAGVIKGEGVEGMSRAGGKTRGKPRVASSKRGRELRAAAALARFEKVNDSNDSVKDEESSDSDTSDTEGESNATDTKPAVDLNGKKLTDYKGFGLIKVCEGEQEHDEDVKREMEELREVDKSCGEPVAADASESRLPAGQKVKVENDTSMDDQSSQEASLFNIPEVDKLPTYETHTTLDTNKSENNISLPRVECPVCSLVNDGDAILCCACFNVLDTSKMADHWRCQSRSCHGSYFINPGDFVACGICGTVRGL